MLCEVMSAGSSVLKEKRKLNRRSSVGLFLRSKFFLTIASSLVGVNDFSRSEMVKDSFFGDDQTILVLGFVLKLTWRKAMMYNQNKCLERC